MDYFLSRKRKFALLPSKKNIYLCLHSLGMVQNWNSMVNGTFAEVSNRSKKIRRLRQKSTKQTKGQKTEGLPWWQSFSRWRKKALIPESFSILFIFPWILDFFSDIFLPMGFVLIWQLSIVAVRIIFSDFVAKITKIIILKSRMYYQSILMGTV